VRDLTKQFRDGQRGGQDDAAHPDRGGWPGPHRARSAWTGPDAVTYRVMTGEAKPLSMRFTRGRGLMRRSCSVCFFWRYSRTGLGAWRPPLAVLCWSQPSIGATAAGLAASRPQVCCMFGVSERRGYPFGWLTRHAEYLDLPGGVPPASFAADAPWMLLDAGWAVSSGQFGAVGV